MLTVATLATAGVLAALLAARAAGGAVPARLILVCAGALVPVAAVAALQSAVHLWRGPPVVSFGNAEAVRCGGAQAEAIRRAARLRGTLGGAGHVYPGRLAVHALAGAAAAALGGYVVQAGPDAVAGWLLMLLVAGGAWTVLLPARAFYYREARNGDLLVTPANVPSLIAWSRSSAAASEGVEATRTPEPSPMADCSGGRGNSPSAPPIASKPADVQLTQER
jgi:hypothetical protein